MLHNSKGHPDPCSLEAFNCVLISVRAFDQVSRKLVKDSVQSAGFSPEVEAATLVGCNTRDFRLRYPVVRASSRDARGDPTNGVSLPDMS